MRPPCSTAVGRVVAVIGSTNVRGHMDRVRRTGPRLEGAPRRSRWTPCWKIQDDDDVSYQVLRAYLADHARTWCPLPPPVSTAVCRAILESGKNIRVLAVDGTEAVLRYMEEGRIAATVDPGALRPGGRGGACAV